MHKLNTCLFWTHKLVPMMFALDMFSLTYIVSKKMNIPLKLPLLLQPPLPPPHLPLLLFLAVKHNYFTDTDSSYLPLSKVNLLSNYFYCNSFNEEKFNLKDNLIKTMFYVVLKIDWLVFNVNFSSISSISWHVCLKIEIITVFICISFFKKYGQVENVFHFCT